MKFNVILWLCIVTVSSENSHLLLGEFCANEKGICIRLEHCESTFLSFLNGEEYPNPCGFEGVEPLVCCGSSSPSISEKKCFIYAELNPDRHVFRLTVVGGKDSNPKEFPHMAALGYMSNNEIKWLCGGTLVSDKFVLTAAHCLVSYIFGPAEWVRFGDIKLESSSALTAQDYKIKRRIPHPDYKYPSVYHDIALIELEKSVKFNEYIRPACLHINNDVPEFSELIVTGWGLTTFAGKPSNVLQKATIELFAEEECTNVYKNISSRKLIKGIDHEIQLCAGGRDVEKDSCQGDSGGPLQIYRAEYTIHSVIGVTSFGKSCGIVNVPGVYTRVSNYIPWLEKNIWPND